MTPAERQILWKLHARHGAAHLRLLTFVNGTTKRDIAARTRAAEDMAAAAFQIVRLLHQVEKAAKK